MGNFLDKIKKTFAFKDNFGNPMSWPEVEEVEAPAKSVTPSQFSHGTSPYKSQETKPFTGIPAPEVTQYDPWFAPPIKSDNQIKVQKEKLENVVKEESEYKEKNKEPKQIHHMLYRKATKNMRNTWQENIGGSENFHEGPGGWSSGTGQNQFR